MHDDALQAMQAQVQAGTVTLGQGARFWAYISPQNETGKHVTTWAVTVQQEDGNWSGTITSDNPEQQLQTPQLSGTFKVMVTASGPSLPQQSLTPSAGSTDEIGCNSNCAAMVGIVAAADGRSATYWTVWDALCNPT